MVLYYWDFGDQGLTFSSTTDFCEALDKTLILALRSLWIGLGKQWFPTSQCCCDDDCSVPDKCPGYCCDGDHFSI